MGVDNLDATVHPRHPMVFGKSVGVLDDPTQDRSVGILVLPERTPWDEDLIACFQLLEHLDVATDLGCPRVVDISIVLMDLPELNEILGLEDPLQIHRRIVP